MVDFGRPLTTLKFWTLGAECTEEITLPLVVGQHDHALGTLYAASMEVNLQ